MPATRGPVPKRSDERARGNRLSPDQKLDVELMEKVEVSGEVYIPEPDEEWHSIAYDWYCSLEESAQSRFYEASDWMTAYLVADQLTRLLNPRFVGMREKWDDRAGRPLTVPEIREVPMGGGELQAILKAMTDLMTTEAARRRMRIEVTRTPGEAPPRSAAVVAMADAKKRLRPGAAS